MNDPIVSGILVVVGGAIGTVILFKFLPWAIKSKLEDIIVPAVTGAVSAAIEEHVAPLRIKVAELEDWKRNHSTPNSRTHEDAD